MEAQFPQCISACLTHLGQVTKGFSYAVSCLCQSRQFKDFPFSLLFSPVFPVRLCGAPRWSYQPCASRPLTASTHTAKKSPGILLSLFPIAVGSFSFLQHFSSQKRGYKQTAFVWITKSQTGFGPTVSRGTDTSISHLLSFVCS